MFGFLHGGCRKVELLLREQLADLREENQDLKRKLEESVERTLAISNPLGYRQYTEGRGADPGREPERLDTPASPAPVINRDHKIPGVKINFPRGTPTGRPRPVPGRDVKAALQPPPGFGEVPVVEDKPTAPTAPAVQEMPAQDNPAVQTLPADAVPTGTNS